MEIVMIAGPRGKYTETEVINDSNFKPNQGFELINKVSNYVFGFHFVSISVQSFEKVCFKWRKSVCINR